VVVGRLNAVVDGHGRLQVQLNEFYTRDERIAANGSPAVASDWIPLSRNPEPSHPAVRISPWGVA
jgi:hypothetical protein